MPPISSAINTSDVFLNNISTRTNVVDLGNNVTVAQAKELRLLTTSAFFRVSKDGSINTNSITITADRVYLPQGTITFTTSPQVPLTGTGDSRNLSYSDFGNNTSVLITATLVDENQAVYTDFINVVKLTDGSDTLTPYLNNPSCTVPADVFGKVKSYTATSGTIEVFEGSQKLTFVGNTEGQQPAGTFRVTATVSPADKLLVNAFSGLNTDTLIINNHSNFNEDTNIVTVIYNITAKRSDGTVVGLTCKQTITKGISGLNFGDAKNLFSDTSFSNGLNSVAAYNTGITDAVTVTRETAQNDSPYITTSAHNIKVTCGIDGDPGIGGIVQPFTTRRNAIFLQRIVAKIPIGYTINASATNLGNFGSIVWITGQQGTGEFEEYTVLRKCGPTGTFGQSGELYLDGPTTPVDWYLAYSTVFDFTGPANLVITSKLTRDTFIAAAETNGTVSSQSLTNCSTTFNVYNGAQLDNANWTITATASPGILQGNFNAATNTYTVTQLDANVDISTVVFSASRYGYDTLTNIFTITKSKQGIPGLDAAYVVVTGEQTFKFLAGSTLPTQTQIVLTASLYGGLSGYRWQYYDNTWKDFTNNTSQTFVISYNNAAWGNKTSLRIRCLSGDNYSDELDIVKLYDAVSTIVMDLQKISHNFSTLSTGIITNYTGGETQASITKGFVSDTANWSYYVSNIGSNIKYQASNDTVGRTGTGLVAGILGGRNELPESNNFGIGQWTNNFLTNQVINAAIAPDNTQTATWLKADATSSSRRFIQRTLTVAPLARYTLSIFAKKEAYKYLTLAMSNPLVASTQYISFDLNTGTVAQTNLTTGAAVSILNHAITSCVNEWYRCSITINVNVGSISTANRATQLQIGIPNPENGLFGVNQYATDGTGGIYIWQAQLETSSATQPSPITPTTGTAINGTPGFVKITELTQDESFLDITAIRFDGYDSITKRFSVSKVKSGADALILDLTNDSHRFTATSDGTIASYTGADTTANVLKQGLIDTGWEFYVSDISPGTTYGDRIVSNRTGTGLIAGKLYNSITEYKNRLEYSDQFNQGRWSKGLYTRIDEVNATADPLGLGTLADKMASNNSTITQLRSIQQNLTGATQLVNNKAYTLSVYAKAAELTYLLLDVNLYSSSNDYATTFNLTTGVVGNQSSNVTNAIITALSNGWYRCSITFVSPVQTGADVVIGMSRTGSTTDTVTAGQGIYIFGAQLSDGSAVLDYVQTTNTVNIFENIITGTVTNYLKITGLTEDNGYVDITASKAGYDNLTTKFTLSKSKAGADSVVYNLKTNGAAISKQAPDAATAGTHSSVTVEGQRTIGSTTTNFGFVTVTPNTGTESANGLATPYTITTADSAGISSYTVKLYNQQQVSGATLLDSQTIPVVFKGNQGIQGIPGFAVELSNDSHSFTASASGAVSTYVNSGTTISVYEGGTELTYDGVGNNNSTWKVTAAGTGITAGTITAAVSPAKNAVVAQASGMSDTTDTASILYTITGKNSLGATFTVTKLQVFSKSKTGGFANVLELSSDNYIFSTNAEGLVSSYTGAETQATINIGPVNDTNNWSYYVSGTGGGIKYRSSTDTVDRTATDINAGILGGTNLFANSSNLSTWTTNTTNSSLSEINTTETLDPVGSNTAAILEAVNLNGSTTFPGIRNTVNLTLGTTYTASIFAKRKNAGNAFTISLLESTTKSATYNLSTGTTASSGASIQNIGNGWYRCIYTFTSGLTGARNIFFSGEYTGTTSFVYTSVNNDFYLWQPQVEIGTVATPVTPTSGTSITAIRGYVKVTELTQDESYLDITALRFGYDALTKRFSVAKTKAGADALLIDLTNDSHTFSSDSAGTIASYTGADTQVNILKDGLVEPGWNFYVSDISADTTYGDNTIIANRTGIGPVDGKLYSTITGYKNALGYSDQFNQGSASVVVDGQWIYTNIAINPANDIADPLGLGLLADKMISNIISTSTNPKLIRQQGFTTTAGTQYNFSVYAKAGELNRLALGISLTGLSINNTLAWFNLTTGATAGTLPVSSTPSITALADGWYRCSISFTGTTSSAGIGQVWIYASNNSAATDTAVAQNSGLYLFGAQLSSTNTVLDYVQTTDSVNFLNNIIGTGGNYLKITGLTQDNGYVDITASKPGYDNLTTKFTLSKAKAGADSVVYNLKTNGDVISKQSPDAATAGTHSSVIVEGQRTIGSTTTNFGFVTVTANTGVESATAVATPYTITTADSAGISSYTVKLYNQATVSGATLLDTEIIPVVFKGNQGIQGIPGLTVNVSNDDHIFTSSLTGAVSTYVNSGTTISVYEGGTELTYDGVGNNNSTWRVTAAGTGITAGTITAAVSPAKNAVVAQASGMSDTADTASILYTVTGKNSLGNTFTITKEQTFSKSKTGGFATVLELSNDNYIFSTNAEGLIYNYSGAETQAVISQGPVNDTNNWSYYVSGIGGGIKYRSSADTVDRTGTGITAGILGGTNLFLNSSTLSSWTASSTMPITLNTTEILDPLGTGTAHLLNAVDANSTTTVPPGIRTSVSGLIIGSSYTTSIFVKPKNSINSANFAITYWPSGGTRSTALFNLFAGSTATAGATIRALSNGWYRCSYTITTITNAYAIYIGGAFTEPSTGLFRNTDGNNDFYIWQPQLEVGTVTTPITPTTNATISATRGYVKVTELTQDESYLDITAVRFDGYAPITKRFLLAKTKAGADALLLDLTNDSHIFSTTSDGTIASYTGADTTANVLKDGLIQTGWNFYVSDISANTTYGDTVTANRTGTGPVNGKLYNSILSYKNLLGYSDQFDQGVVFGQPEQANKWNYINVQVNPVNTIADPLGLGLLADKIVSNTSTTASRYIRQIGFNVVANTTYNLSIYAKAAEINRLGMAFLIAGTLSTIVWFDLSPGTVSSPPGGSIEPLADGWYRCSITITPTSTSNSNNRVNFYISNTNQETVAVASGSGLYLFGAQLSPTANILPYTQITNTFNTFDNLLTGTDGKYLKITGLNQDNGYVDITASQAGYDNLTHKFTLSKSKAGADPVVYTIKTSGDVISKQAPNAATAGTHSSVIVEGQRTIGSTTTNFGFVTVTANNAVESTTAVATPYTITTADSAGISSYTVKLYNQATVSGSTLLDTEIIPVVFKGESGFSPINVYVSNDTHIFTTSNTGIIGSYFGSDTTIQVYEGLNELTYDGVGTSNSTWKVTAVGNGITPGTITAAVSPSTGAKVDVASGMADSTDTAIVSYTITGKSSFGTVFTIVKEQSFSKSKTGSTALAINLSNDSKGLFSTSDGTVLSYVGADTKADIIIGDSTDTENWSFYVSGISEGLKYRNSSDTVDKTTIGVFNVLGGTNLISYSNNFNNTTRWITSAATVTFSSTNTTPDGANFTRILSPSDTSNTIKSIQAQSFTFTSGTQYTFSCFIKRDTVTNFTRYVALRMLLSTSSITCIYDLQNGTAGTFSQSGTSLLPVGTAGTIQFAGNGWYRCIMSVSAQTTASTGQVHIAMCNSSGQYASFSGFAGQGLGIFGAQLETGNVATPLTQTDGTVPVASTKGYVKVTELLSSVDSGYIDITGVRFIGGYDSATARFTVNKLKSGEDSVVLNLTRNNLTLTSSQEGLITSYADANTQVSVTKGDVDDTSNWSYYISNISSNTKYRDSDDTTDRTGTGPVFGSLGGQNLLTYSNNFTLAWSFNGCSASSSTATTAPDLVASSSLLIASSPTSSLSRNIGRSTNISATVSTNYTFSCYVKANGTLLPYIVLQLDTATVQNTTCWGWFNVLNGTKGTPTTGNWTNVTTSIRNIGNGWYRCILTATSPTSATNYNAIRPIIAIGHPTTGAINSPFTTSSNQGFYLWGAQFEQSSTVSSLTRTENAIATGTSGFVKLTELNQDNGYLEISAIRYDTGYALLKSTFSFSKAKQGISLNGYLTNPSQILPADNAGNVPTGAYSLATGTFTVEYGITNVTTSTTFSVESATNITATIGANTGIYTVSNMTADNAIVRFKAVYGDYTIFQSYSLSKSRTGATGQRGSIAAEKAITGTAWSDTEANAYFTANYSGVKVLNDSIVLYNNAENFSETRYWDGSAWIPAEAFINGNLIVTGTITGDKIAANAISTTKLAVGSSASIFVDNAFQDTSAWGISAWGGDAAASIKTIGDAAVGRNVAYNVSGTVRRTIGWRANTRPLGWIPVDSTKKYRLRVRFRAPNGDGGRRYIGLTQCTQDGTLVGTNSGHEWYTDSTTSTTNTNWVLHESIVGSGTAYQFNSATKFVSPAFLFNWNDTPAATGTGEIQVSGFEFEELITGSLIVEGTITATNIAAGTITANNIAANTITANNIASNTITANNIAAGTITANNIAANTITANNIASNTITANNIAANTITADKLVSNITISDAIFAGTLDANNITVLGSRVVTPGGFRGLANGFVLSDSYFQLSGGTSPVISRPVDLPVPDGSSPTSSPGGVTVIYVGHIDVHFYTDSGTNPEFFSFDAIFENNPWVSGDALPTVTGRMAKFGNLRRITSSWWFGNEGGLGGTVRIPFSQWFVDSNDVVYLNTRFALWDNRYTKNTTSSATCEVLFNVSVEGFVLNI